MSFPATLVRLSWRTVSPLGLLARGVGHALFSCVVLLAVGWQGASLRAQSAVVEYSVWDLGDLGAAFARARAVNDEGQVVGEALLPQQGIVERGFLWEAGSMFDLGTAGGSRSRAQDINAAGIIGGWAQNSASVIVPVLWDVAGVTILATLEGGSGSVWGLNDSGQAVGQSSVASGQFHATLWDAQTVRDLGTLGGDYSIAYDINNSGLAVGSSLGSDNRDHAVLWGPEGALDLGGLSGGSWTTAHAINDMGQSVLWGVPAGGTQNRATFWSGDLQSEAISLGTFGGNESWAYDLNNHGTVVGSADLASGTYHAFVWDGSSMADLGTLGGLYSAAFGINDNGVVVGWAHDGLNRTRAVAWVPVPEPSAALLLMLGVVVFSLVRRRHAECAKREPR